MTELLQKPVLERSSTTVRELENSGLLHWWIWHIYPVDYYSSIIRRNKFESVRPGQMDLESIIQSEVSQKNKYRILTHVYEI